VAVIAAFAAAASLSMGATASAAPRPAAQPQSGTPHGVLSGGVISITVKTYGAVLADRSGHTLYLLTTEAGSKLHCTSSACLDAWPPLLLTKGQKVGIGSGVKGKVSTIARSSTTVQVTFNGYPVYTYAGDSGKAQTNGEKIVAFGGTWYMLRPTATTAATTAVK
jgi:predicted lipoprotein with Yx(FWY)xxD motif